MQLLLVPVVLLLGGCSVLVGNIRPSEQDAARTHERKLEIPPLQAPWVEVPKPTSEQGGSDTSWQHSATGSTLSFTSGCRKVSADPEEGTLELDRLSSAMTGGLTQVTRRRKRETRLHDSPAVESIIEGNLQGRSIVIRTLITRKQSCVYDVTLVSLKRFFDETSLTFDDWISRMRLP